MMNKLVLIFFMIWVQWTWAQSSLQNFQIQFCDDMKCVQAEGAIGYLSMDGLLMSADQVQLMVNNLGATAANTTYNCETFRYLISGQSILCEYRIFSGQKTSLLISKGKIKHY